jgi:predicted amidophosphoribosyltransferase
MRCPFCAEDVNEEASVCRHCGNDLKFPETLIAENAQLKERVATLQRELLDLNNRLVLRKHR